MPTGNYARYEPTLGQIVATLGYQVNVGDNLKTYLNVNQVSAFAMAPPPAGDTPSDELVIRDFVLADPTKPAVLLAPARFAPKVDYPFGWFATGSLGSLSAAQPAALPPLKIPGVADFPPGLQHVAAMSSRIGSDSYTSDHSEMVFPINVVTQMANPPLPADLVEAGVHSGMTSPVHRYRVWPLKDRAGNPVANSYSAWKRPATRCSR